MSVAAGRDVSSVSESIGRPTGGCWRTARSIDAAADTPLPQRASEPRKAPVTHEPETLATREQQAARRAEFAEQAEAEAPELAEQAERAYHPDA